MSETSTTSDFTVMFRYRLPGFGSSTSLLTIATNTAGTDDVEIDLHTDGSMRFISYLGGVPQEVLTPSVSLVTNTNYHIAIVHTQGSSTKLYVNGTQVSQLAGITYTVNEWGIGAGGFAPDVAWVAENPKAWQRALSAAEVASEIMTMSPVSSTTSLWDWWNFNQSVANFGTLDGQVNGAARQVKYQGDFTLSTDTLELAMGQAIY